jgi:DNA-binding XRE family transcriptional regulator
LTPAIQQMPDAAPEWAKTQDELAAAIGVTPRTLRNWQEKPRAPKKDAKLGYNIAAWIAFAAPFARKEPGADPTSKQAVEIRKLDLECQKREHELAVLRGEYTANTEIAAHLNACVAHAMSVLRSKFEVELPAELAGKSKAAILDRNKAAIDDVCRILSTPIEISAAEENPEAP